jgi:hypothetical protein
MGAISKGLSAKFGVQALHDDEEVDPQPHLHGQDYRPQSSDS